MHVLLEPRKWRERTVYFKNFPAVRQSRFTPPALFSYSQTGKHLWFIKRFPHVFLGTGRDTVAFAVRDHHVDDSRLLGGFLHHRLYVLRSGTHAHAGAGSGFHGPNQSVGPIRKILRHIGPLPLRVTHGHNGDRHGQNQRHADEHPRRIASCEISAQAGERL